MKNLILLFVLFPIFSFSQVLFENPKTQCYLDKNEENYDCFELLEGSKIYVEDNYVVFDIVASKSKYKILEIFEIDKQTYYSIDFLGDEKIISNGFTKSNERILMILDYSSKEFISYR